MLSGLRVSWGREHLVVEDTAHSRHDAWIECVLVADAAAHVVKGLEDANEARIDDVPARGRRADVGCMRS